MSAAVVVVAIAAAFGAKICCELNYELKLALPPLATLTAHTGPYRPDQTCIKSLLLWTNWRTKAAIYPASQIAAFW